MTDLVRRWIILLFALSLSFWGHAKGLDELNSEQGKTPQKSEGEKNTDEAVKKESQAPSPEGAAKNGEGKDNKEEKIEPSESSKALADKLSLRAGFALAYASGSSKQDNWGSSGMSHIALDYLLEKKLFGLASHVGFRYAPFDVIMHEKEGSYKEEYRGVIENYLLGVRLDVKASEKKVVYSNVELGLFRQNMKANGDFAPTGAKNNKKFGAIMVLGGGLDYRFGDKVLAGPQLNLGLGQYALVQTGIQISFVF